MSLSVGSGTPQTSNTTNTTSTGGASSTSKTTGTGKGSSLTITKQENQTSSSNTSLSSGAPQIDPPAMLDLSKVNWAELAKTLFSVAELAVSAFGLTTSITAERSKDNADWVKLNKWYNEYPDSAADPKPWSNLSKLEEYGISKSFLESQGIQVQPDGQIDVKELNKLVTEGTKPNTLSFLNDTIDALAKTLTTLFPDSPFVKDLATQLTTLKSIATEALTSYLTTGKLTLSPESMGKLCAMVGTLMQDTFQALGLNTELKKLLETQPFPGLNSTQSQFLTNLLTGSISIVSVVVAGELSGNPKEAMDATIKALGLTTMNGTAEGALIDILKNFITGNGELTTEDQGKLLALFNPSATPNIFTLATETAGVFLTLLSNFGTTLYSSINELLQPSEPTTALDADSYALDSNENYAIA